MKYLYITACVLLLFIPVKSQVPPAVEQFLSPSYMQGASLSLMVKNTANDSIVYCYDADRELIPASIMKLVTTATALELFGEDFRYETAILYDGQITDSILNGNLYIKGGGDPTVGSADFRNRDKAINEWINAIKKAGIKQIDGSVIADESIFDTEGVSMKWLLEDLGSSYGQGAYGINVFDNRYTIYLNTGQDGAKPHIDRIDPEMPSLIFRNYLTSSKSSRDSTYIIGAPLSNERFLYGVVPANRRGHILSGDIPEPALFLAQYITKRLTAENITVTGVPSCYRQLVMEGKWKRQKRQLITKTFSVPLKEIVRITNYTSNNLNANTLLKTIGLKYQADSVQNLSSYNKGILKTVEHWNQKGLNTSSLWMYDGSGLSPSDKTTARFMCDLLSYMAVKSEKSKTFVISIPRAGVEGTVRNTLKGSLLEGKIRLKSGSMNRIRSYAGYIEKDGQLYALALILNNYSCTQAQIKNDIEQLFLSLF